MRIVHQSALLILMATLAPRVSAAQSASLPGQVGSDTPGPSAISSVKLFSGDERPAVEITSNRQVIPAITRLDSPPRLIIDLPNAELSLSRKRIEIRSGDIKAVRLAQYHMTPPVVQVVVELAKPEDYTWEAAGNRLIVRLQQPGLQETRKVGLPVPLPKPVQPDLVPTALPNPDRWTLVDSLAPGASVTASTDSKLLRLENGEIDICPGTTLSVTRSRDRSQMMLAINTGTLETHYVRENSEDSILTPDFRILLRGPGEFHYAIKVDSRGNACVRSLPGNTGLATVSKLFGNGVREVRSGDKFVFHPGRFRDIDTASEEACGCAALVTPLMRTLLSPPLPPDTAPLPILSPSEVHLQVDVPLVFSARSLPDARALPLESLPDERPAEFSESITQPPVDHIPPSPRPEGVAIRLSETPAQNKPSRPSFFGKIKSFTAGLFR